MHDTMRVGYYWDHIPNCEIFGECPLCKAPETLQHILLECNAPERKLIFQLTENLWRLKYNDWPSLSWGLVLGCNLVRFTTASGQPIPQKDCLFSLLISIAWQTIWNMRVDRRLTNPGKVISRSEAHNIWLKTVNRTLRRDCILTDQARFGALSINTDMVLKTWSGLLLDEDSLPDNWIHEKGVLVGILPMRTGVG